MRQNARKTAQKPYIKPNGLSGGAFQCFVRGVAQHQHSSVHVAPHERKLRSAFLMWGTALARPAHSPSAWKRSRSTNRSDAAESKKKKTQERASLVRRQACAARLQRWFRSLHIQVWDLQQAGLVEHLGRRGTVRLVEPGGLAYDFRATSLALLFVSEGQCVHPLTRRELLSVEVSRLMAALPARHALLLRHTLRYSEQARRASLEFGSLRAWLEKEAGEKLDAALLAAEFDAAEEGADVFELLDQYEDAVLSLDAQMPAGCCRAMLQRHEELAYLRRKCCDPTSWLAVKDHLDFLSRQFDGPSSQVPPPGDPPALVSWLLQGTRRGCM